MPSGKEMQLWWSGEAESMFVYYLTGALAIALIASFTLTRSLRRKEPLVTELLHEDNTREVLVTYMLEIVTSPLSGCGCPSTVKVFMQLTGEREMSQYFQIRSNTGGKAMLQRGFTDIFMFKVPESVGEILSVKLLMAGLDDQLKWKVEEAFLYSPSAKQRKEIPVVVKLLEVLDQNPSKNMLIQKSNYMQLRKLQLLYHQWLAMYGNTIRVGAFTEVVHVMSVFMSLFALLVLSQMCYIYLPRGDHTLPTVSSSSDSEEVDSGPFDIKLISLLIGTVLSTVCCFFLTFVIEILIRSVKSREKNPGKAYYKICEDNIINFKRKYALCLDNVEHVTYFTHPLFLRFKNCREEIESKPWKGRKFTEEVALYLEQLLCNLQIEFEKYWKDKEVLKEKKMKVQEASEERIDLEREKLKQEADRTRVEKVAENADTVAFPSCSQNSWPKPVQDKKTLEKEKEKKKIMLKSEEKMTIDFPRFSQIWSSGLKSVRAMSFRGKKLKETYLDVLKKKNRSKCTDRDNSIIHVPRNKVGENKRMQENHLFKSGNKCGYNAMGEIENTSKLLKRKVKFDLSSTESTFEIEDSHLNVTNLSEISSVQITKDDAEEFYTGIERSQTPESFKTTLKWMEERNKNFYKAWQSDQKTWCRKVVRELSDVIRCTREMLLKDQINFNLLKDKLQHSCNTVVQLFVVACSLYCTADQYKQLNTPEMVTLSWHMAVEVLVYVLQEFYQVLLQRDNAVLADLVLQSHCLMKVINFAVNPIIYMVKYGADTAYLMSYIPIDRDLDCMIVELLKCCFQLVVKYNRVLWQKLQFLVEMELKDCLDESCYTHLSDFVDGNIRDVTTENIVLKKLCNFVEESSKQEAWDEIHEEKTFFTSMLVKVQLLKTLKSKITKISKIKYTFDETHDLLPKEPKSRLQLLLERRRKPADVRIKHVKWSKLKQDSNDTVESKECLEKHSKELGQFEENLTCVYKKLKRLMERQGVSQAIKASEILAQAVLHPHVIVLPGRVNEPGMYTFDNYLNLKRTEVILAQFYEAVGKDLMSFLLTTCIKDHKLNSEKLKHPDTVLNDIIIKADTMAQLLYHDIESVMHDCVKMEQYLIGRSQLRAAANSAVNRLLQTSVLQKWSDLDVTSCTPSKVLKSNKMQDTAIRNQKIPNRCKNRTYLDHKNSSPDVINLEVDARKITLTDIMEDLKPLKGYLEYIKHGEVLRKMVTQMGYIDRAKSKRDYLHSVQINNIIDSYFMTDEGDDSETLTKSGLYQLEYDCTGENRKPLGSWVKVITVSLMMLLQIFIVVYITIVGGQFTTTELQEWMCYFLLAVGVFGLVFEPVKAYIVGLYVRKLNEKLWAGANI